MKTWIRAMTTMSGKILVVKPMKGRNSLLTKTIRPVGSSTKICDRFENDYNF